TYYLVLSAILFTIGVAAFIFKRNIITIFMSIELMLNAVNLSFVAFANMHGNLDGHIFVFFVMVVAAAEAAVGLAIIISVFRTRETLNVDRVNLLKLYFGDYGPEPSSLVDTAAATIRRARKRSARSPIREAGSCDGRARVHRRCIRHGALGGVAIFGARTRPLR